MRESRSGPVEVGVTVHDVTLALPYGSDRFHARNHFRIREFSVSLVLSCGSEWGRAE
jgi:hypothetical protein